MAEVAHHDIHHDKAGVGMMAAGSSVEAITGLAAVVLTALGLAQFIPQFLLIIAVIVVGAGLFLRGGAVAAEYSRLIRQGGSNVMTSAAPSAGVSAELVAGAVGIVLGVLALMSVAPMVLTPVAAIILAVGLIMNSMTNARINKLRMIASNVEGPLREASVSAVWADSSAQMLACVGTLVLGALALLGFYPAVLTLVGVLTLGTMELLAGGGLTSRALGLFKTR